MTRQEAEENLGKYVAICAPGLKRGYKIRKILEVHPHDKTLLGKGSIVIQDKDGYGKKSRTRMSFEQAQLYEGDNAPEVPERRKRRRNNSELANAPQHKRRRNAPLVTNERRTRKRTRKRHV